jgi:hypothetical protein
MKLLLTRIRSLCTRNRAALGFAGALLTALLLTGFYPAGASPSGVSHVPALSAVDDDDLITLLSLNLGGRDVAVAAWSNMNPFEKQTLRDQAVRIAIMAQAAERDGLSSSPDVARTLRWGAYSFLASAWEKKISSETDLSENAVRSFYEANRQMYKDEFEKCASRVKEDMIRLAILERLERPNSE